MLLQNCHIKLVSMLLILACCWTNSEGRSDITDKRVFYLLTLLPYRRPESGLQPSWDAGDDIQPVLNMAADDVNACSDTLANYSLKLIHSYDGCDDTLTPVTLASFAQAFAQNMQLAGVIGPGCSSSTGALANLTGRPELGVVTVHDAGSPKFENRSVYPYQIGILGSTQSFIQGFYHLLEESKWKKIAILFDDTRQFFISTKKVFLANLPKKFEEVDVEYISPVSLTRIPLEGIRSKLIRVVFVLATISITRRVMCRALELSMTSPRYQYVITSSRLGDFRDDIMFDYNKQTLKCSHENLINGVLKGSFLLTYNLLPDMNKVNKSVFMDYHERYRTYRENYTKTENRSSFESNWATNLYDAVWAWAKVLDKLTKQNASFEVVHGNRKIADQIVEEFYSLEFDGMSGRVSFDNNTGYIQREVVISQVVECGSNPLIIVGPNGTKRCNGFSETDSHGENGCNTSDACNLNAHFIADRFDEVPIHEHWVLGFSFLLISSVELIVVIMLHILTIAKHNSSAVKASSLKLLNISYVGTYILISGALLRAFFLATPLIHKQKYIFCQLLWAWTIPLGFSLAFGPVVMKTWRLYRIFEHYLDPGPFISTPWLIVGTLLVTVANLLVSVAWTLTDPYFVTESTLYSSRHGDNHIEVYFECKCDKEVAWLGVVLGFIVVLILVGVTLAALTNNIKNRTFTTSSLVVLVYLMSLVVVLWASVYGIGLLLRKRHQLSLLGYSYLSSMTLMVGLNITIFLFIACIFSPPLVPLARKAKATFKKISSSSIGF